MKTILIIDDEELLREVWELQFESEGYKVILASSGNEGVACLKNNSVDIILTDLRMPGSDGIVVLKYLSQNNLSIPTFVCSGFLDDAKSELKEYNIKKIIIKPFQLEEEYKDIVKMSESN